MTSAPAATSEMDPLDQLGAKAFDDDLVIAQERSRAAFTTDEWRDFLIRSIGLEPTALDERAKMVVLLRMAPFVERNFNKPRSCTASPGCRRAGASRRCWKAGRRWPRALNGPPATGPSGDRDQHPLPE